jgi:hypothetical protein
MARSKSTKQYSFSFGPGTWEQLQALADKEEVSKSVWLQLRIREAYRAQNQEHQEHATA